MPLVVGDAPGCLRLTIPGQYPESLPSVLFTASIATRPPYAVSIRPAFPAVIHVNGAAIGYDTPTRLLVGDTVSIHAHSRGPALLTFLYSKNETEGSALTSGNVPGLPIGGGDRKGVAHPSQAAGSVGGAASGAGSGTMTLRSIGAPEEHRGLTFAAFVPPRGRRPFDDL